MKAKNYRQWIIPIMFGILIIAIWRLAVTPRELIVDNQGPLFYQTSDTNIYLEKLFLPISFSADSLLSNAEECGNKLGRKHFAELATKFQGLKQTVYNFNYSENTAKNTYTVTLIPNAVNYKNLEEFKKDFDLCSAGEKMYPTNLSDKWLMFTSSCGSGFDDGSGMPNGCELAKEGVEKTLSIE